MVLYYPSNKLALNCHVDKRIIQKEYTLDQGIGIQTDPIYFEFDDTIIFRYFKILERV